MLLIREVRATRILGLDIGDRRIGVALSDPDGKLATPFSIIDCQDDTADVAAIIAIVNQQQVERIIVGLPRSMDGALGRQAEKVAAFTRRLSAQTPVPVEFRDERLTTVSARRLIREANNRKSKKKTRDDAIAAALILQGYLDEEVDEAGLGC
ncbi:MAG: Holliday junction resolvase RuvX [Dehalococcoidales bacterium]|nr:Holliday junction resolvase RuvX [Dehalococcoidales bacterium]